MSDASNAKFDPKNLKGLLLIRSKDAVTNKNYFAIASYDLDRIRSTLKKAPQGLEDTILDMADQMQRWREIREMQGDITPRTLTFAFIVEDSIDSYILADDIDEYDGPSMKNLDEFLNYADSFAKSYLSNYRRQQAVKNRDKVTENVTIYDIPEQYRVQSLVNLSLQLVAAAKANDPLAQIETDEKIRHFVSNPDLMYHVNNIVALASSTSRERDKLMMMQCAIIDSLIKEDYSTAASLHKSYTKLTNMKLS